MIPYVINFIPCYVFVLQILLKCGDCGVESDGFHASVDHMGEYHPQYYDGDKQAICIFCLKVR